MKKAHSKSMSADEWPVLTTSNYQVKIKF